MAPQTPFLTCYHWLRFRVSWQITSILRTSNLCDETNETVNSLQFYNLHICWTYRSAFHPMDLVLRTPKLTTCFFCVGSFGCKRPPGESKSRNLHPTHPGLKNNPFFPHPSFPTFLNYYPHGVAIDPILVQKGKISRNLIFAPSPSFGWNVIAHVSNFKPTTSK